MSARGVITVITIGLLLAACGSTGSSVSSTSSPSPASSTPSATASSAPELLPLTVTCPEFQAALDAHVADAGNEDWAGLAAAVDAVASHAEAADASLFTMVSAASTRLATTTDQLADENAWFAVVDRLSRACKAAGSPLK